jgi:hypothetical protein
MMIDESFMMWRVRYETIDLVRLNDRKTVPASMPWKAAYNT